MLQEGVVGSHHRLALEEYRVPSLVVHVAGLDAGEGDHLLCEHHLRERDWLVLCWYFPCFVINVLGFSFFFLITVLGFFFFFCNYCTGIFF